MSRPKDIIIAGLALSTAALVWVAWRQQREIHALATAGRTEEAFAPTAVRLQSGVRRSYAVAVRPAAAGETVPQGRIDGEAGPAVGERRPAFDRERRGSSLSRLMENGEFVQALGQQRHAMLDTRFAALFRRLGLSGEELAGFKRLLVEKENVVLDVVTVSETNPGGPLSRESLRASVDAAQVQVEQLIQRSLGDERYALYRDYERTLAQRATVAQLEQRLSYTGAPLTPAQSDSLVSILAAHAPAASLEISPAISVIVRAGVPEVVPVLPTSATTGRVTDAVVVQAQTVLAPAQVAALREIQDEQNAAVRATQIIREFIPGGDFAPIALPLYMQ